jgi:hypothetical protein
MPTTLPVRIAAPASTVAAGQADASITIIFLVATIGMLLSVLAALLSPDYFVGM